MRLAIDQAHNAAASGEVPVGAVVLVIGAVFMGTALTVRDLVGERAIFERERAVGLRPSAYLAAKIVVFFVLAVLLRRGVAGVEVMISGYRYLYIQ